MPVKKGNPVEFTRTHIQNYIMGDGEFGIASENERSDGTVLVELSDNTFFLAKHIHAYNWGGWLPDELEDVYTKYNG